MNTRITVETTNEIRRIKARQKEVEQLKDLLLTKGINQFKVLVKDSKL